MVTVGGKEVFGIGKGGSPSSSPESPNFPKKTMVNNEEHAYSEEQKIR
jgi:hypothetical protein